MRALSLLLTLVALPGLAAAQGLPAPPPPTPVLLVVGVTDSPPLSYQTDEGAWSGLAVQVWQEVAAQVGLQYELRPILLNDVAQALNAHRLDAAIGAIAVTPEGAALHDFSQPFLVTGLGFAQRRQEIVPWQAILRTVFDPRLLSIVAAIVVAVLVVGVIIALVERRERSSDFGGSMSESVSMGVWWAAVTMTTVGYGDATPKTGPGRALALVWMFVGVVTVAILTATVTSVLTVAHLRGAVERPADLLRLRLGALEGSAGADYLENRHVSFTPYPTYEAALLGLDTGAVDAVVANIPVLRSLIAHSWTGRLQVSPMSLEPVLYAVGVPNDSPLIGRIDRALLAITHDERWRDTEERFLGHH